MVISMGSCLRVLFQDQGKPTVSSLLLVRWFDNQMAGSEASDVIERYVIINKRRGSMLRSYVLEYWSSRLDM